MQAIITLPRPEDGDARLEAWRRLLFRRVAGVGLLNRVIATASRAGIDSVLLVHAETVPQQWLRARLAERLFRGVPVRMVGVDAAFDADDPSHWRRLEGELDDVFVRLPFNFVTVKKVLSALVAAAQAATAGIRFEARGGDAAPPSSQRAAGGGPAGSVAATEPVAIQRDALLAGERRSMAAYVADLEAIPMPAPGGINVDSARGATRALHLLVRGSGKPTDGLFSNFNRRLCWPSLRMLLRTRVTANAVTFAGLWVVVLAGFMYALGTRLGFAAGGLLYFIAVEFDEIDGMLARTKFQESAFGCWLETFADYLSYLILFIGVTIGLYRQSGAFWLLVGASALFGCAVSFVVLSRQRRLATPPGQPEEYLLRLQQTLEADAQNMVSRFVRIMHIVVKRGVMCHGILWLSLVPGGVHFLLLVAAIGANITWTASLYTNRLFRKPRTTTPAGAWGESAGSPSTR